MSSLHLEGLRAALKRMEVYPAGVDACWWGTGPLTADLFAVCTQPRDVLLEHG